MHTITVYNCDCFQNAQNKIYPNKCTVNDLKDLAIATKKDNVCCLFENYERANNNFIEADSFSMDLDNGHTENPKYHKTIEDIKKAFPDVEFYFVYSRNHNKVKVKKDGTELLARYKIHVYFPLSKKAQRQESQKLTNIKIATGCLFPYFDNSATDIARFYFGINHTEKTCGGIVEGKLCIDEYLIELSKKHSLNSQIKLSLDNANKEAVEDKGESWQSLEDKPWNDLKVWIDRSRIITGEVKENVNKTNYTNIGISESDFTEETPIQVIEKCKYFENFAKAHNIKYNKRIQGMFVYYFVKCPWEENHTESSGEQETKITILPLENGNSAIRFNCWHTHCTDKNWNDYKKFYEAKEGVEDYLKTNTAEYLQGFIDGIIDNQNIKPISTGFEMLDEALEGGLYEGIYILGAISSLGKTTFALQIIDQIAELGNDVIIFSLEMARNELIAKSVSRNTYYEVAYRKKGTELAKTTRGILTGSKYKNYSPEEKDIIKASIEKYGQYANHIYIHEGVGDIGVKEIKETVEKHIEITGNKPVILIDYIQILAPVDVHYTDKQNMDKTVLELKRLSRDKHIPIIGVSSLNRASYKEAISMEAFKESGAIEYSADVLLGLQLKGVGLTGFDVNQAKNRNPREIEAVILKNRNGITGSKIPFEYNAMFNVFTSTGKVQRTRVFNKKDYI